MTLRHKFSDRGGLHCNPLWADLTVKLTGMIQQSCHTLTSELDSFIWNFTFINFHTRHYPDWEREEVSVLAGSSQFSAAIFLFHIGSDPHLMSHEEHSHHGRAEREERRTHLAAS